MAFKINDERAPLDQFLQGESVRAYEFLGSHFVNWDGRQGVVSLTQTSDYNSRHFDHNG